MDSRASSCWRGPTTYTDSVHITNDRDMIIMQVEGGKQGKAVGVVGSKGEPL